MILLFAGRAWKKSVLLERIFMQSTADLQHIDTAHQLLYQIKMYSVNIPKR